MDTQEQVPKTHSPLPWRWLPEEGQFIVDAKGNTVGEIPCQGCNPVDGAFIVTAVNEHAELIAALKTIRSFAYENLLLLPKTRGGSASRTIAAKVQAMADATLDKVNKQ